MELLHHIATKNMEGSVNISFTLSSRTLGPTLSMALRQMVKFAAGSTVSVVASRHCFDGWWGSATHTQYDIVI